MDIEKLNFLTKKQINEIASAHTLPVYIYSESRLIENTKKVLSIPNAYGMTARFAMKACPNANILNLFISLGLHLDASSGYEVERALKAGIAPEKILLSAQELPHNLKEIIEKGVHFNACSTRQLKIYGELFPGKEIGVRFNPGLGTGGNNRTNVGGPGSSFGIWHEQIEQVQEIAQEFSLKIIRIHTHIGSGTDPEIWQKVSKMSIEIPKHFPDVQTLNLGGGFKVSRMSYEKSTDLQVVGESIKKEFINFYNETRRKLKLEIEPGTFLVANAGSVIAKIDDVVSTGESGYKFYKANTGMTDILRPSIYGAQHPIVIVKKGNDTAEVEEALVVGHCCESGDILTPEVSDPEGLKPRKLSKAEIGDYVVIEGAGAYCSSMSSKNYNSFPESSELLIKESGEIYVIRKRQSLDQIVENEVIVGVFP